MQEVNYSADGPYLLLSESLVFSLFGLLFQLYTSVVGQSYQKKKTFKVGSQFDCHWLVLTSKQALKRNRWLFLCHIMILSIPIYLFGISLLLLIFGAFSCVPRPFILCLISHPTSHLHNWLPILFYFSTRFHRSDIRTAFVCLFISILPSPFYSRLHGFLWGKRDWDDDDSDNDSDVDILHEKGAGTISTGNP